jgi:cell division protein ZapA (FtsZ GTPase activity inhibitor)
MTPRKPEKAAAQATVPPSGPGPSNVYSTTLNLCGEQLQLRTDQSPEVVQRLAGYINAKIKAAGGVTGMTPDNFRLLALAALGITGELFETKAKLEDHEKTSQRMLAQAESLTDSLDRVLAHPK